MMITFQLQIIKQHKHNTLTLASLIKVKNYLPFDLTHLPLPKSDTNYQNPKFHDQQSRGTLKSLPYKTIQDLLRFSKSLFQLKVNFEASLPLFQLLYFNIQIDRQLRMEIQLWKEGGQQCRLTLFCGCDEISQITGSHFPYKLFFCIGFIFIISVASVRLGTGLFVFKDYYPLKQRSPILCILMLVVISLQIQLYPILYIYNFFGNSFSQFDWLYRLTWYSLKGMAQFIYFLRSMRIIYAHQTDPSRRNTKIFKIFKNQFILAAIVILIIIFRSLPVLFQSLVSSNQPLLTPIQFISPFRDMQDDEADYLVKILLSNFMWQIILVYCYWLQHYVNNKYTIGRQILIILISKIVLSLMGLIYILTPINENSPSKDDIFRNLCLNYQFYPIIQLYEVASILVMVIVTIIVPLLGRKIYHMLLPTGRQYGLVKTMRDFLLEQQFLEVFQKYLTHMDLNNHNTTYSNVLGLWKKLIVLKYNIDQSDIKKINQIRAMLNQLESTLLENDQNLIINLKSSLAGLQESFLKSEDQRNKYRDSINQKIDQLEAIAIQKLDNIYKQEFTRTQSYYYLKKKTKLYNKININMILLNLAIITDTVEEQA